MAGGCASQPAANTMWILPAILGRLFIHHKSAVSNWRTLKNRPWFQANLLNAKANVKRFCWPHAPHRSKSSDCGLRKLQLSDASSLSLLLSGIIFSVIWGPLHKINFKIKKYIEYQKKTIIDTFIKYLYENTVNTDYDRKNIVFLLLFWIPCVIIIYLSIHYVCNFYFTSVFGAERQLDRQISPLLIQSPKCLPWLGRAEAEFTSQKHDLVLQCGWQQFIPKLQDAGS